VCALKALSVIPQKGMTPPPEGEARAGGGRFVKRPYDQI